MELTDTLTLYGWSAALLFGANGGRFTAPTNDFPTTGDQLYVWVLNHRYSVRLGALEMTSR